MPENSTDKQPHARYAYALKANAQTQRMCRRPAVEEMTGLSRSTIYEMMSRGEFPRPVRLGKRAVGWPEGVIAEWLESRLQAVE